MLLSQRNLQMVTFLSIFFLVWFATCQETKTKRGVAEFQFLHNKGNLREELNRLIWLHQAMGGVHTAVGRDIPQAHIVWTSPKNQDLSNLSDGTGREESLEMMTQLLLGLLEKEEPVAVLRKTNVLQYLKNVMGNQDLQDLSDIFQGGDQDGKINPSTQT